MTIKQTSDAVAVTRDDAIKFLETAVRNWGRVHFDQDGLEDVRVELERFAARHRLASTRPMAEDVAGLVEDFTSALRLGVEDDVTIPFDLAVRIHATLTTPAPAVSRDDRQSAIAELCEGLDAEFASAAQKLEVPEGHPDKPQRDFAIGVLWALQEAIHTRALLSNAPGDDGHV